MMKIQVAIPPPSSMDPFDFNDARPSPFLSAPSTPKGFGNISSLSAPTSPSRISEFYDYFDQFSLMNQQESVNGEDDNFAFDFSSEKEESSSTADELFHGGKLRPLELPPRLKTHNSTSVSSPRSPIQQVKKMMMFSPRKMSGNDLDPFAVAAEITRNRAENGRQSRDAKRVSPSTRRASRSVSPLRVSELCPWEEQEQDEDQKPGKQSALVSKSQFPSNATKSSSRKWRLKDFLLFRSASEGRGQDKDPFSKFRRHHHEDGSSKDSSFGDGSGSARRKGGAGQVSAHELHYTVNKTVSQNLKKKTFLPYKQGILGRFAVNPAAHVLSGGYGRRN